MLTLLAPLALVVALWLWHPLIGTGWRYYLWTVLVTALLGALPAGLIWLARNTDLSYAVVAYLQVPSGWLFASIVGAWLLAVVRDVFALLGWGMGSPQVAQVLWQPKYTLIALSTMLLICGHAAVQGLRVPEVREHELRLATLPSELDGLRIAVLADLHASPVNNMFYVREVVARTNAAKPDLIVLPGDLVDGDAAVQAAELSGLADLNAPYGVWAAPGNHEYYSGYDAWANVFAKLGLAYLANRAHTIDIRGQRVTLSGVGDPAYHQRHNADAGGVPPDIVSVAQQAHEQGTQFHILLGHQPKMARQYAASGSVHLQIAGHTHGGHIRGFDQWVVARANQGFVRGRYDIGGMTLFVSSGAGLWSGFTLRLGVPAAIDVLTLRSDKLQSSASK